MTSWFCFTVACTHCTVGAGRFDFRAGMNGESIIGFLGAGAEETAGSIDLGMGWRSLFSVLVSGVSGSAGGNGFEDSN